MQNVHRTYVEDFGPGPQQGYIINGEREVYPHKIEEHFSEFPNSSFYYASLYYYSPKTVVIDKFQTVTYVEEHELTVEIGDHIEVIEMNKI